MMQHHGVETEFRHFLKIAPDRLHGVLAPLAGEHRFHVVTGGDEMWSRRIHSNRPRARTTGRGGHQPTRKPDRHCAEYPLTAPAGSVDICGAAAIHCPPRRGFDHDKLYGIVHLITRTRLIHLGSAALICLAGCATTPSLEDDAGRQKMLALLLPHEIEIVAPFTRVMSFDDDPTPDGIELLVQAVNSLGYPGTPMVGTVRVELYEHVPASGDNKGRRLEHWTIELTTEEHQRSHWNQITQMYEFRLQVDPAVIPASNRFVLLVTYNSPLGEHLTDESVIQYRTSAGPSGGAPATTR